MKIIQGRIDAQNKKSIYAIDFHTKIENIILQKNPPCNWGDKGVQTVDTSYSILDYFFINIIAIQHSEEVSKKILSTIPVDNIWELQFNELQLFILTKRLPYFNYQKKSMFNFDKLLKGDSLKKVSSNNYIINVNDNGDTFIQCNICSTVSYHPDDISNIYCGNCRMFLEK